MLSKIPTYIFLGQSNMDGRGNYPTHGLGQNGTLNASYTTGGSNNDTIIYWKTTTDTNYNGVWQNLEEFVNNASPADVGLDIFGPEMAFMVQMADFKGTKCALIKLAIGGSGVNADMAAAKSWNVAGNGNLFQALKTYIEDAFDRLSLQGIPDLKAAVWYQGWSDSDTLAHATDYEANLTALIEGAAGLRDILGGMNAPWQNTPVYLQASPAAWVTEGTRTLANYNAMEASKEAVADLNVNSTYLADGPYSLFADDIHLSGDDYSQLGTDLFNTLKGH